MSANDTTTYCTGYAAIDAGRDCTPSVVEAMEATPAVNASTGKAIFICLAVGLSILAVSVPIAIIFKHTIRKRYERSLECDPELNQLPELRKHSPWMRFGKGRNDSRSSLESGSESDDGDDGGSGMSVVDLTAPDAAVLSSNALRSSAVIPARSARKPLPRSLVLDTVNRADIATTIPSPAYTPRILTIARDKSPSGSIPSPLIPSPMSDLSSPLASAKPLLYQLPVDPLSPDREVGDGCASGERDDDR